MAQNSPWGSHVEDKENLFVNILQDIVLFFVFNLFIIDKNT